ncbi:MAG: class II glutamine amidotransferase, partial [Geminicoccaceae bacterium]|nr:class II glutamine amidotransferase [Geminicoccaceae bacterium]
MCRWLVYRGDEIFMEELILQPHNALIHQSLRARLAPTVTNGDGFGVGWYGARPEPGVFRDILPAWNDPNLRNIAQQVRSRLFMAHVRASTGTATSRANCHPFAFGRWLFMHNGQIG